MRHEIIDASQLELTDKVVSIKRVTKVTKGGNTMRFTALVVVGDMNGHVGVGLGKAKEIPEAIRKGKEDATKKLVTVVRDENNSIPHDNLGKFGSASVLLKKSPEGTGTVSYTHLDVYKRQIYTFQKKYVRLRFRGDHQERSGEITGCFS